MPLDPDALHADPLVELAAWVDAAEVAGHHLAHAFALATADADGRPSVRFVLLRGVNAGGLEFFTSRDSLKGSDLAANPRAAAAFWWEQTNRQVRVSGAVEMLDAADTTAYWDTRPRGHQLAAWASAQSQPVEDRRDARGERGPHDGAVRGCVSRPAAAVLGRLPARGRGRRILGEPRRPAP